MIQAQNNYRIAKNDLSNLLGYNLPRDIWDNIPLKLDRHARRGAIQINLPNALQQALDKRPNWSRCAKPRNCSSSTSPTPHPVTNRLHRFSPATTGSTHNLTQSVRPLSTPGLSYLDGWNAGAQLNWDIFDGLLTHGKVVQARALYSKSKTAVDEEMRDIELEVRTAYSDFLEAQQVLESQKTVQDEAEESLREANARAEAGTGTQLDVLDAENSLTQARSTQVQALHDYDAARARFERAIGAEIIQSQNAKP